MDASCMCIETFVRKDVLTCELLVYHQKHGSHSLHLAFETL
jgi:hypothetical protein